MYSIAHVPQSVRPLLAQVLAIELEHGYSDGLWGFVRLFIFAKCILRTPSRGGRKKRYVVSSLLSSHLNRWHEGQLVDLRREARNDAVPRIFQNNSTKKRNINRSINLAQEGRYGDAIRALTYTGCAPHHDKDALNKLKYRHAECDLPMFLTTCLQVWHVIQPQFSML